MLCTFAYFFQVFWFGVWKSSNPNPNHQETYSVLAMELLGKSLHELLKSSWFGAFRLRTVMVLADQVLEILQFVHSKFIAHRDIKPGNLVMGTGENCNKVYLIDFGLASSCAQHSPSGSKCQTHIPNTKYENFILLLCERNVMTNLIVLGRSHLKDAAHTINGSLKYCSINSHYGRTLSRRDDIVSLGYMLILLLNGNLPWSPIANKYRPDSAINLVLDMKLAFDPNNKDMICNSELSEFLQMAQNLAFEETPDYIEWRAKFIGVFAGQDLLDGKMSLDWDGPCFLGEAAEATCELSSTSKSSKVLVTL